MNTLRGPKARAARLYAGAAALLVALAAALVALNVVFLDEREDALKGVDAEEAALLAFARSSLAARLAQRLDEARPHIRAALADPLADESGLLLALDGSVELPRAIAPLPGAGTPALARLAALSEDLAAELPGGSPYASRVRLLAELRRGLQRDNREAIEMAVRALLAEQALHRLPPSEEVPYALALVEALASRSDLAPPLLAGLLREGLGDGAARIEGLQRLLLLHRGAFTAPDFAGLSERVVALSARAGVKADDFVERVRATAPPPLAAVPPLAGPSLLLDGRVYAEPDAGALEGIEADLEAELRALAGELIARGLLAPRSVLFWQRERAVEPLPIGELALSLSSPAHAAARADARTRYRLKAALLVGTGGLAALALALSFALDRRRRRFVELKARFLAAVSHELRTPLASLQLLAETLERRAGHLEEARDYPRRMLKDLDGLSFLVENLLSLQRVEKGRLAPRTERVDLEEVVCALEDDLARVTDARVQLSFEASDEACELLADPELVLLCLANLLRNACLYNARDPVEIRVTATREGGPDGDVVVRIHDNGVGIPAELRPRLFEDFVRGQDLAGKNPRGSGIGLALCRDIAVAHGGSLTLEESSPAGSTFELRLPGRAATSRRSGGRR